MASTGVELPFKRIRKISLRFRLPYYTQWGENLAVCGSDPGLGAWDVKKALRLVPHHHGDVLFWHGTLTVAEDFSCEYNYCVVDDQRNVLKWESGKRRSFSLPEGIPDGGAVDIYDLWRDGSAPESLLSRSAFRKAIFCQDQNEVNIEDFKANINQDHFPRENFNMQDSVLVRFRICCPQMENGKFVCLTGSASALGNWNFKESVRLSHCGDASLQAYCIIRTDEFPIRYKYFVKDKSTKIIPEIGSDRELSLDSIPRRSLTMIFLSDGSFRETPWRGAGVAIPVFSLRSNDDVGAGEFLDLKLLVDLSVKSGLHLIQLLPVNDTSVHGMWWDSYPYSSLSVFALHPLYLRVQALSQKMPEEIKQEIEKTRESLNLKDVDYDGTMAAKLAITKKVFDLEKNEVLSSDAFQRFFQENEAWLKPYAAFCFLRDFFETSDHSQWGRFSEFSKAKLEKLVSKESEHYNTVAFHYYLQFHLHLQLLEAAEYARKNQIVLKGDLPIGVDRHSVDTWVYPNLFRMNTSTGAPPDYFDKNGQNWGFPTYNWEEMSKDNYAWWQSRLTQMGKYFTAYRIDHILGFFRIWELPEHAVTGLMGKFRPSIPLSQEELEKQGIWDFYRLSQPYVIDQILQDKFGSIWRDVASKYLYKNPYQRYEFKEEYNTEKKILAELKAKVEPTEGVQKAEQLKEGLFDLLHEIVLIRDPEDPSKFYPRFGLEETTSFKELDDHSKNVLKSLYYDYYFHRQEKLWRQNALKTLPALLNSSDMLACGEDLGLIPACVHPVMQELGLIGLRIQRMPSEPDLEFGIPANYGYMTVCAPSCHDCSTLRAWWEEDEGRRIRFFRNVLGYSEAPPAKCDPKVAHAIMQQHVEAPSIWAIFPLQDLQALKEEYSKRPAVDETINDPTNPKHYWRFRVHINLEMLLADENFQMTIKDLIKNSGRSYPGKKSDFQLKLDEMTDSIEGAGLTESACQNGYASLNLKGGQQPKEVSKKEGIIF
uniref:4-alpha-glucanotransferase n=1 Tax=Araucaria cunninghamii TaxID=56994 RepID=A0A0D6QV62_ARACU